MTGDPADIITMLIVTVTTAARAEGLDPLAAKRLAQVITDRLRREYGTTRPYIPAPDRTHRDRAIIAGLANGDSRHDIADRLGVHPQTVSRVARRRKQADGMAPAGWTL